MSQKPSNEESCRLCGIDSFGYIRIPNTRHNVCIPCARLVKYELEKEGGG